MRATSLILLVLVALSGWRFAAGSPVESQAAHAQPLTRQVHVHAHDGEVHLHGHSHAVADSEPRPAGASQLVAVEAHPDGHHCCETHVEARVLVAMGARETRVRAPELQRVEDAEVMGTQARFPMPLRSKPPPEALSPPQLHSLRTVVLLT